MRKKRTFTPATAQSVVVTIRAVFPITDDSASATVEDAVAMLRSVGAAEVIERGFAAEGFHLAAEVLKSQRHTLRGRR